MIAATEFGRMMWEQITFPRLIEGFCFGKVICSRHFLLVPAAAIKKYISSEPVPVLPLLQKLNNKIFINHKTALSAVVVL